MLSLALTASTTLSTGNKNVDTHVSKMLSNLQVKQSLLFSLFLDKVVNSSQSLTLRTNASAAIRHYLITESERNRKATEG